MPAPRQLRLHLGVHKTATTHLQTILGQHRDALRARGVAFAGPGETRPALRAGRRWWHVLAPERTRRIGLPAVVDRLREQGPTLALSEENILGTVSAALQPEPYRKLDGLRFLARLAEPAELRIFVSIRSLDRLWPSAYAEVLRHFRPDPLLLRRLEAAALTAPPSWLRLIEGIRAACPEAPLTVWCYEDYRAHWREIAAAFVGDDIGAARERPPPRWTVSPSAEGVRRAERLTMPMPGALRRRRVRDLYLAHPMRRGAERFAPFAAEAVAALRRQYALDLDRIRREHPGTLLSFTRGAASTALAAH